MLQSLLDEGWNYHDTESERLAGELEAAAQDGVAPELVAPFLHLAIHTIGQHLQDWPRALTLGKTVLQGREADAASDRVQVAALMAGDGVYAAELELAALETAGNPLARLLGARLLLADILMASEQRAQGAAIYRSALALAGRVDAPAELDRRLAATGNNIAWTLHDLPSRSADEVALMLRAAESSLAAWRRCGDWVNEELALSLQASVALAAGDPAKALDWAASGLAVIAANGARPYDAAYLHLLRSRCFADPEQRRLALAAADQAADAIAVEALRHAYAAERAKLDP